MGRSSHPVPHSPRSQTPTAAVPHSPVSSQFVPVLRPDSEFTVRCPEPPFPKPRIPLWSLGPHTPEASAPVPHRPPPRLSKLCVPHSPHPHRPCPCPILSLGSRPPDQPPHPGAITPIFSQSWHLRAPVPHGHCPSQLPSPQSRVPPHSNPTPHAIAPICEDRLLVPHSPRPHSPWVPTVPRPQTPIPTASGPLPQSHRSPRHTRSRLPCSQRGHASLTPPGTPAQAGANSAALPASAS